MPGCRRARLNLLSDKNLWGLRDCGPFLPLRKDMKMDVVVCTPQSLLLAKPVQALADALEREGNHVRWVQSTEALPKTGVDLVVLTAEVDRAAVRRACRQARVVEVAADQSFSLAALLKRAGGKPPDMTLSLFPRALRLGRVYGPRRGLFALPEVALAKSDIPVWLYAMPKDMPTVLLFPKTGCHAFAPVWERAASHDPCNLICFADAEPGRAASNVYFKHSKQAAFAFSFAQCAVVEEDETLVLRSLREGVPVIFVTNTPRSKIGVALKRLGVGIATRPEALDAALQRMLKSIAYSRAAAAFAATHSHAPGVDVWVKRVMDLGPPRAPFPVLRRLATVQAG